MKARCKKCGELLDCTPNKYVIVRCKCGASAVDAEKAYVRCIGDVEWVKEEEDEN